MGDLLQRLALVFIQQGGSGHGAAAVKRRRPVNGHLGRAMAYII